MDFYEALKNLRPGDPIPPRDVNPVQQLIIGWQLELHEIKCKRLADPIGTIHDEALNERQRELLTILREATWEEGQSDTP